MGGEGELDGIEDILPDDIGCGAKRRHGIEESIRHPNAKRGVLLSESLSGSNRTDAGHGSRSCSRVDKDILIVLSFAGSRQIIANEFTESKLQKTSEEGRYEETKNNE